MRPRSSDGKNGGLLNRVSQVRVLPGAPFILRPSSTEGVLQLRCLIAQALTA